MGHSKLNSMYNYYNYRSMILFCVLCISSITLLPGPKISQNVNYTQRGTMEGPKAPSEARRREAPECRGSGAWGGAP